MYVLHDTLTITITLSVICLLQAYSTLMTETLSGLQKLFTPQKGAGITTYIHGIIPHFMSIEVIKLII
jgi:hypothetical protein